MKHALAGLNLKLAIQNATRICAVHGEYPTPIIIDADGNERGGGCPRCRDEAQLAEWVAALNGSRTPVASTAQGVPRRFEGAQFSTFLCKNEAQKGVLRQAYEFADHFPDRLIDGGCMTFLGATGTGKTRLACSIANTLAPAGYRVRYTSMYSMIDSIRETWGEFATQTTREAIADYVGLDLLIIDELAVSRVTSDNEKILLFRVIDGRYEACRPTLLISNQDYNSFGAAIGDRVIDRLIERGELALFEWSSLRGTVTEEPPQAQLSLVVGKGEGK